MIDGHTQLVGVIGWPVEHSLSPIMHNAAFDVFGLNWRYVPLPVRPGEVEQAVKGLAALGFRGANVTVPHKQAVLPVLTSISADARRLGAVNTLVFERDGDGGIRVVGHNTDVDGFIGALREAGFDPYGTRAVIVGAGGAARAVVAGLAAAGCAHLVVLGRDVTRARTLVTDIKAHYPASLYAQANELTPEKLIEEARTAALLVNATPVGMWPYTEDSIWPENVPLPSHLTVFDLVYNPLETRLLAQARRAGAHAVDGLGMLVRQGALAFQLWTQDEHREVEELIEVMRAACKRALMGRPD